MKSIPNPFSNEFKPLSIPENTYVVHMDKPDTLKDVKNSINYALEHPICSDSLEVIASAKKANKPSATATIVISDNTRPVPYKGEDGILMPVIDTLLSCGYKCDEITILVATGMHRAMKDEELRAMLDPKVYEYGIRVVNHNAKDESSLVFVGTTKRGTKAMIDRLYMEADLKIATGLVESHFMAGASGGRKAICPGIIGEESTYIFHGPELMDAEKASDLIIDGNPVHEESLAVAKLAGVDFLVNVTLDHEFKITGIFTGDLEKAHRAAVEKIKDVVEVKIEKQYDVVITHGGFVGINHYQCAKCGVASLGALKKDGYLIAIANATDSGHVIGSPNYRVTLALLHLIGPENFVRLIKSPDWTFLPEQWQVQQWAKVFKRTDEKNFYYYAPQIKSEEFSLLPGVDVRKLFDPNTDETASDIFNVALEKALLDISKRTGKKISELSICFLADGPYEIPRVKEN